MGLLAVVWPLAMEPSSSQSMWPSSTLGTTCGRWVVGLAKWSLSYFTDQAGDQVQGYNHKWGEWRWGNAGCWPSSSGIQVPGAGARTCSGREGGVSLTLPGVRRTGQGSSSSPPTSWRDRLPSRDTLCTVTAVTLNLNLLRWKTGRVWVNVCRKTPSC